MGKLFFARIILLCLVFGLAAQAFAQIPAFPGAEGYGSTTPGGRGGLVIKVTNLDPDGPGSLRAALEAEGPRVVVFETGGTIDLGEEVAVTHPFLTIAGQTAPGDGISINNGTISIQTNDVIVRGLRFRVGDLVDGPDPANRDGLEITSHNAYNVIVDHCSFAWAIDENVSASNKSHDLTFSWNIIGEGLHCSLHPKGCHSKGLMQHMSGGVNYSVHHNVLISNHDRNPQVKAIHCEVINNYVYNYGFKGTNVWMRQGSTTNLIGNFYKPGPDTRGWPNNPLKGIFIQYATDPQSGATGTVPNSVYVLNNIGPGRETITSNDPAEEWQAVDDSEGSVPGEAQSLVPFAQSGITAHDPTELEKLLLSENGAGAIVPHRDPVDERIINTIFENSGSLIDCVTADPLFYDEGTARGGTATTITLAAEASRFDNKYRSEQVEIIAGTGSGQIRTISSYDGQGRVATVDRSWDTIPDNTSRYHIVKDCARNAGGWPEMAAGTPPKDSDDDGMPDDWETANGLNPNDPSDANGDADGDGYTNIEEYINGLIPLAGMTTDVEENGKSLPHEFLLYQNYPNPFNPSTTIRFTLPQAGHVTLQVFDVLGREVAVLLNEHLPAGEHSVVFDARGLSSGVYFYRLTPGSFTQVRKAILMR